MYNNNYYGNAQYVPPYNYMYQNQTQQKIIQPIQQEMLFSDIRFGTLDEAKAYLLTSNKPALFINRNNSEFYIKSLNSIGEPVLETFKYGKVDNLSNQPQTPVLDTNLLVKKDDLKDFATKDDVKSISEKINSIEKRFLGGVKNAE